MNFPNTKSIFKILPIQVILPALIALFAILPLIRKPAISKTSVMREYLNCITIIKDSTNSEGFQIRLLGGFDKSHPMSKLINPNQPIIGYLVANAPDLHSIFNKLRKSKGDSMIINRTFQDYLKTNIIFKKESLRLTQSFLSSQKGENPNYYRNYSMDDLIEVASRFYYPTRYTPQGTLIWKTGLTTHGWDKTPKEKRDLLAEAFVFDMFSFQYHGNENSHFRREIRRIAQKSGSINIKDMHLSEEHKLEQIRTNFYHLFSQSKVFRQAIRDHYQRKKEILDFNLLENQLKIERKHS